MQKIRVEIVSDVVCPWCYVGLAHFRSAVAQLESRAPGFSGLLEVSWSPYQLNPRLPAQGLPRQQYLLAKFGAAGLASYGRVADAARAAGLPIELGSIEIQPNTLKSHLLVAAAADRVHDLVDRLFEAFFVQGKNLADDETLLALAQSVGFDRARAQATLGDTILAKRISRICAEWVEQGISGVPTFRLRRGDDRFRQLHGAVAPSVMVEALMDLAR
ncbi:MAG: DsbA family oxidoreductase [Betaproteobacteria bacterium]|nr:DsbA family oxidoreductase [Betaproteobacteria bacterium]